MSSMRKGKVVRINGNNTYDIVHASSEDRLEKQVPEDDLRAPEGLVSYGDLIALVKVCANLTMLYGLIYIYIYIYIYIAIMFAGTPWQTAAQLI